MFYQPGAIRFADAATHKVPPEKLVIGVSINNETKAYPIQIIGYHHQVRDTVYKKQYDDLADYENGTIKGSLEKKDSASWKAKSWVIGIKSENAAKAYDWNDLVNHPLIQDTIGTIPVPLVLGADPTSFHVWSRNVQGQMLQFEQIPGQPYIKDSNTGTTQYRLLPVPGEKNSK